MKFKVGELVRITTLSMYSENLWIIVRFNQNGAELRNHLDNHRADIRLGMLEYPDCVTLAKFRIQK